MHLFPAKFSRLICAFLYIFFYLYLKCLFSRNQSKWIYRLGGTDSHISIWAATGRFGKANKLKLAIGYKQCLLSKREFCVKDIELDSSYWRESNCPSSAKIAVQFENNSTSSILLVFRFLLLFESYTKKTSKWWILLKSLRLVKKSVEELRSEKKEFKEKRSCTSHQKLLEKILEKLKPKIRAK